MKSQIALALVIVSSVLLGFTIGRTSKEESAWFLFILPVIAGYVAAIALESDTHA